MGKYDENGQCNNKSYNKHKPKCCRWDVFREAPDIRITLRDRYNTRLEHIECPNDNYACQVAIALSREDGPYTLVLTEAEKLADTYVGTVTFDPASGRTQSDALARHTVRVDVRPVVTAQWVPRGYRKIRDTFDACFREIRRLPLNQLAGEQFESAPLDAMRDIVKLVRKRGKARLPTSVSDPEDMVALACTPWARTVVPRAAPMLQRRCPCCD